MSYSMLCTLLFIAAIAITLIAQVFISVMYKRYSGIRNSKGISGAEVAREILKKNGIDDVYVVETKGYLSDHYDPGSNVIRLSTSVYNENSISSASIAAHEVGHAIQHHEGNAFLRIRSFIVPIVNIASKFGYIAIFIGLIFSLLQIFYIGIIMLSVIVLFQLVTLPVEFDASRRALNNLEKYDLLVADERKGAFKVLGAAALTYVAGLLTSLLEIVRLLLIFRDE